MFHQQILNKIRGRTSGRRALEYIYRFWVHDRLSTFPAFHRAAQETARLMEEIGLSRVEVLKYPTTGSNLIADWEGPQGWDATSGILDVTTPEGNTRRLVDRQADPCHLFLYCGNTPPEGIKTGIVKADSDRDIKGKLVFQDKVPLDETLRQKLIEHGALGVVSDELPYWPEVREREENIHLVRWHNAFLYPQNKENLLGLSITPADGDWLREALQKHGEVEAFTRVDTRLYADTIPVTTGIIPGTEEPDKEVWLIQHLHEVGAHDNASGVACALEVSRTLLELAARGILDPPKRTVRVICSWEIIGFMAHLCAHPEIVDQVICAINPDMVGADQDHCRSWLQIYCEPHCNPSFIDELTIDLIKEVYTYHPRWHWESKPFMINDNFLADPMIGIPCPSLIFLRDRYYHTSSDRPENLSPVVMEEISALMAACAYTVTNGGLKAAEEIAELVFRAQACELVKIASENRDSSSYDEWIQYYLAVAEKSLDSVCVLTFGKGEHEKAAAKINSLKTRLSALADFNRPQGEGFKREPKSQIEREADSLIPKRKIWGSFSLARVPKEVKKERTITFSPWDYNHNAPVFWADGKRSIFEIQWLVGQELGKTPELDKLMTLFRTLQEYGYVALKKR
ncbi:MAG TPA: M28 family peptidase [archaeon]|nr:M28 family peptidase [archaeon]